MSTSAKLRKSATQSTSPPKLPSQHSGAVTLLAIVFLAMAVLQLIRFNEFEIVLAISGLDNQTAWAVGLILAELLAAVGFFRIRISHMLRVMSATSALFVAGFWFFHNLRLIADGMAGLLPNTGFFGDFFAHTPGWWTTLMSTILVFWVIYSLNLMRSSLSLDEA